MTLRGTFDDQVWVSSSSAGVEKIGPLAEIYDARGFEIEGRVSEIAVSNGRLAVVIDDGSDRRVVIHAPGNESWQQALGIVPTAIAWIGNRLMLGNGLGQTFMIETDPQRGYSMTGELAWQLPNETCIEQLIPLGKPYVLVQTRSATFVAKDDRVVGELQSGATTLAVLPDQRVEGIQTWLLFSVEEQGQTKWQRLGIAG